MRFVEFLPGWGQKAVEITKIAQIAAPLPGPAAGHLCQGRHIIWPGKSRTINTNISCCQIYLLLLSWVELSQQHWHPKDNQKVKIDNFFNKMQDDNPEPGPERLRLIYHDRLESWSLRRPISSRYSEDLTNQRPPTPVSASCQGCSFQKWNWAEIAATLSRKMWPSAVLWWGSAVNKIKLFENICVNMNWALHWSCQPPLECISGYLWLIRSRTVASGSGPYTTQAEAGLCADILW